MFPTCQSELPTTQFSAGILSFLNIFSYLTFSARLWITNDSILYRYFTILWYYPAYIQRVEYVFVQRLHFFRAQQLSSLREFWLFVNRCIRNMAMVTPSSQPLLLVLSFFVSFFVGVLSLWNMAMVTPNAQSVSSRYSFTIFFVPTRNNFVNFSLFRLCTIHDFVLF